MISPPPSSALTTGVNSSGTGIAGATATSNVSVSWLSRICCNLVVLRYKCMPRHPACRCFCSNTLWAQSRIVSREKGPTLTGPRCFKFQACRLHLLGVRRSFHHVWQAFLMKWRQLMSWRLWASRTWSKWLVQSCQSSLTSEMDLWPPPPLHQNHVGRPLTTVLALPLIHSVQLLSH